MLCIANMNLKKLAQTIFLLCSNVFSNKLKEIMEIQFLVFFLSLEERKSDENDDSDFETLLHFAVAMVAE